MEILKRLTDFVVGRHYAGLSYEKFFQEVCRRTALLIADWMRLGFVHGVMNTDNMSVLGLTIDYGPYGWLEGYDPQWTPNTTDAATRRYCYGNQPQIAQWNLARFGEALLPLCSEAGPLEEGLTLYAETFNAAWRKAIAQKLGLEEPEEQLVSDLFTLLYEAETDFTLFFRNLASVPLEREDGLLEPLRPAFYGEIPSGWQAWLARYQAAARRSAPGRVERMNRVNPKYVFRNYLAQLAIDALERGDASVMERQMKVLERPYDEQPGNEDLAQPRPEWARSRPGCSALSCSS